MEAVTGPWLEWGVAALTLPGQGESGDRYVVRPLANGVLVAVMDGLGLGEEAAVAAKGAVATLERHADESVIALVRRCHENLRATRGVVMSLASFNGFDGTMTWLGVGNVGGTLVRADPEVKPNSEFLLLRGGVIGGQLPPLQGSIISLMPGDTLILHTDGIRVPTLYEIAPGTPPQQIAGWILETYAKGTDDALVLVGRYIGNAP
jgi:serine phosphatase RsbU (regulator of sigma subunit)